MEEEKKKKTRRPREKFVVGTISFQEVITPATPEGPG